MIRLAAIAALACCATSALAEEKPLWELGLGVGALAFPDYRGSDETSVYPVPIPYVVYRGTFLKADRDGVRGELFNRDVAEFNISLNGTIPVNSEDNAARTGMPDLDPTIEVGTSLNVHLWRTADRAIELDLMLPIRAPITLESSPQAIGWVFSPRINLDIDDLGGEEGWSFGIGVGAMYAARRYHEYFYDVAPRYATAQRPAYEADGGYSGLYAVTALSKRFPKYWVGAYLRYEALSGAEFEDSPLMRTTDYLAGGVGIAWMIGKSKRTVDVTDE